jgi:hypothetical protein
MTKEEILIEKYSAKIMNWEDAFKHNPQFAQAAHEAMEEYAKQEIVSYELWLFGELDNDSTFNYDKPPEQLYELYQQSKMQ